LAILRFTNFGVRESVKKAFALFRWRALSYDFAPGVSDHLEPAGDTLVQYLINLLPEPLSNGRAFAVSGDGNLQIAATHNSGKIKIAVRRIVHGIAEDAATLGFEENGAIDGRVGSRRNGEKNASEIVGVKFSRQPSNISGSGELLHVGIGTWCDDGDAGTGF
jgi:hypothetical protein